MGDIRALGRLLGTTRARTAQADDFGWAIASMEQLGGLPWHRSCTEH